MLSVSIRIRLLDAHHNVLFGSRRAFGSGGLDFDGYTRCDMDANLKPAISMHNVGIVVESLDGAITFFEAMGLSLEGRMVVEGEWSGRVTGLQPQKVEIAMMVTPDGHSRLELSRFLVPDVISDHRGAPVNSLGYLRVMFAVADLDAVLAKLLPLGGEVVAEVVQYEDIYRLCYVRGPEGILIGLAQEL